MNTPKRPEVKRRGKLVAIAVALTLTAASTAVLIRAQGAAAPPLQADKELRVHRVHFSDSKVGMARLSAEQKVSELRRQLDAPKPTDHGSVLTLGDVLFASGRADLQPGALSNLNELVNFLYQYPDRRVALHGYTDSLGGQEYNQELSERRANSVKAYLTDHGIDSTRLQASGVGWSGPVAGNESRAGRQLNRRVEVIISNAPVVVTQRARSAKLLVMLALFESVTGTAARPLF